MSSKPIPSSGVKQADVDKWKVRGSKDEAEAAAKGKSKDHRGSSKADTHPAIRQLLNTQGLKASGSDGSLLRQTDKLLATIGKRGKEGLLSREEWRALARGKGDEREMTKEDFMQALQA